jgi:hypothetical protein
VRGYTAHVRLYLRPHTRLRGEEGVRDRRPQLDAAWVAIGPGRVRLLAGVTSDAGVEPVGFGSEGPEVRAPLPGADDAGVNEFEAFEEFLDGVMGAKDDRAGGVLVDVDDLADLLCGWPVGGEVGQGEAGARRHPVTKGGQNACRASKSRFGVLTCWFGCEIGARWEVFVGR